MIQLIEEKDEAIQDLQDERHRIADAFKNAIAEAKAQTLRAQRAETEAKAQTARALHLEAQNRHLKLRVHTLVGQLTDLKKSGTWKVLSKINHLRAMLSGRRRRNE